jgi:hypothetical protein
MPLRVRPAALILAVTVAACSSDSDDAEDDTGGAESDAGDTPDASAPEPDAAPDDAAPPDAAPDATPGADAAPMDAGVPNCGRIRCDCTFEGIPLFGRVQYVDEIDSPMIRVSEAVTIPDLRVQELDILAADSCGEWQIVNDFPDFTVAIVDNFEDFEIEYSMFPGIP